MNGSAATNSIGTRASLLALTAGTAGMLFVATRFWNRKARRKARDIVGEEVTCQDPITTVEDLRQAIPAGLSGSTVDNAPKVLSHLDDPMVAFIERAPMVFIATAGKTGLPFVSPKGDDPGFVRVVPSGKSHQLLVPDRPGNRLVFGWQNVIENPQVGLLFQIPGNDTTLRVGGRARLYQDPGLCREMAARGVHATLVLVVQVDHAFFHCSKAYIRSKLWKPESWPKDVFKVSFGRYFSSNSFIQTKVDAHVDQGYEQVRQSVQGIGSEPA